MWHALRDLLAWDVVWSCRYFAFLEECATPKACTILLRGGSKDFLNEVERNLQDAMQVARNVVFEPKLLPGGGATEMAISVGAFVRARLWTTHVPILMTRGLLFIYFSLGSVGCAREDHRGRGAVAVPRRWTRAGDHSAHAGPELWCGHRPAAHGVASA